MGTVTKRDLTKSVAEGLGCTKLQAKEMVDCLFKEMLETLIAGDRIEVRGFGVLTVKNTRPKPGARNPRTGEAIHIPARRKVHFKPGKELKEAMLEPLPPAESKDPGSQTLLLSKR